MNIETKIRAIGDIIRAAAECHNEPDRNLMIAGIIEACETMTKESCNHPRMSYSHMRYPKHEVSSWHCADCGFYKESVTDRVDD